MKHAIALSMLAALVASGSAQVPTFLYSPGRSVADQGITLTGWGAGTVAESDETAFEGTTSIRVSSRNFFQGGIVRFTEGRDLAAAYADANNLLMFAVRVADASVTVSGGGAGSPDGAGIAGAGAAGGGGGGGMRGGEDDARSGQSGAAPSEPTGLQNIRLVITTTDGLMSEATLPMGTVRPNERGWRQVGFPLRAIRGFDRTNKNIRSIAFAANTPSTFFIGESRILNDSTPIYGELMLNDMNIGSGEAITLQANGFGGATQLKYTWNIVAADGRSLSFEGQAIQRRFRVPGTYKVSVTVSDVFGLKPSFTTNAVTITVN